MKTPEEMPEPVLRVAREDTIPQTIAGLYERLAQAGPPGEMALEDKKIVWRLPNGVLVEVWLHELYPEAYIGTSWTDPRGRTRQLTHWHPVEEEIFRDLLDICQGRTFWVKKKRSWFEAQPIIMEQKAWERLSEKKRRKYERL